ncbi:MAG: rhamnulokinase [Ruminococcaceae bacterium]|nr:rhamnulokinase [Oscillospiraceae bacterium]
MANKKMLAIDLGASSGRGIIGKFDGEKITLEEIHRFSNDPVMLPTGFYWDTLRILFEIKTAILNASHAGGVDTIGIDTWGVDYGYLDKNGALLSNPYNYRDVRTEGIQDYVFQNIAPLSEIYGVTGIQSLNLNSIYQIAADLRDHPWVVENAETMLFMPDLLGYMLTGEKKTEYTIASTGAILDAEKRDYALDLLAKFGLPEKLHCEIVQPGTELGALLPAIEEETGNTGAKVIKVASHDTASAVLAVPAEDEDFLYISSGTWSLMGIESKTPVINELSAKYNFTNEGGVFGTIRILKNIMGLWIEQESRRQWTREGTKYSFDELSEMALASKPFQCFIDPDDQLFATAGNMPRRIREYCEKTGQHVPETVGEIVRCIFESLALRYRWTAEKLEELTGRTYPVINIVGGGTKEEMLSQFTADASHRKVCAGPVEATALGNIAMQCIASGEIKDMWEARRIIRNSTDIKEYAPDMENAAAWDEAYARFLKIIGE